MPSKLIYCERKFNAMGSPCELRIYAQNRAQCEFIVNQCINEVERLESRYSRYRPTSLLSSINELGNVGGRIKVDVETVGLLNYVDTCYRESDGLFDVTSGVLRRAWNFRDTAIPAPSKIASLLCHIGWDRVNWEPPILDIPVGFELDLGGAVKEYAVDRLASMCWESGVVHGLINLGGDIKIVGPHPDGKPWAIGISSPRTHAKFIHTVYLWRGALATSGDYERCIQVDGVKYGHVLNPKTGWPVRHLSAVTVAAELCVVAGSASTIAMLKENSGADWLNLLGLPHFWVDVDGNIGGSGLIN